MKTSLIAVLVLFAATAAVAAPAANASDFCAGAGQVLDIGGAAYATLDAIAAHDYLFSIWLYAESNGEAGLQRGGLTLLGDPDICQDSASPDQGVF